MHRTDARPGRSFGIVVGRPGAGATRWLFTFRAVDGDETEVIERFDREWEPQQVGFRAQVAAYRSSRP